MVNFTFSILILTGAFSIYAFYSPRFYAMHLLYPYGIVRIKQAYPLLTNGLIHFNFLHLILNLALIFIFGNELERTLGEQHHNPLLIYLIWIIALLTGSIFDFLVHRNNSQFYSCGASHVAMALMACYLVLDSGFVMQLLFDLKLGGKVIFLGVFLLTAYKIVKHAEKINYKGHAVGLGVGSFMAWCIS